MPAPGMPDFSAMAKEATVALTSEPAQKVDSSARVAQTETTIPPPETVKEPISSEPTEVNDLPVEAPEKVSQSVTTPNDVVASEESKEQLQQKVFDLPEDALVNVKIDGEDSQISVKEYKDLLRKNATLTKRQQEFAKSREQANQAIEQRLQEIQWREHQLAELAQRQPQLDPVTQAIVDALKGNVAPKPKSPDEIATYGEIQAEREQLIAAFNQQRQIDQQQLEQTLAYRDQQRLETERIARERQQYMDGIKALTTKKDYAVLAELAPNLQAEAMFHVKNLKPRDLNEALEFTEDYIKDRADKLKKVMTSASQKQQASAVKQKMESPEGSTPTILKADGSKKTFINKAGKLDFGAMSKDALARMNAME